MESAKYVLEFKERFLIEKKGLATNLIKGVKFFIIITTLLFVLFSIVENKNIFMEISPFPRFIFILIVVLYIVFKIRNKEWIFLDIQMSFYEDSIEIIRPNYINPNVISLRTFKYKDINSVEYSKRNNEIYIDGTCEEDFFFKNSSEDAPKTLLKSFRNTKTKMCYSVDEIEDIEGHIKKFEQLSSIIIQKRP